MLRVDIRAIDRGPIEVAATVDTGPDAVVDLEVQFREPIRVTGRIGKAGLGRYYWHGAISTAVGSSCPRCLEPTLYAVNFLVDVTFTEEAETGDPTEYVVRVDATALDLGAPIRDELLLAIPEYVLCDPGCKGLCSGCGIDLNVSECKCKPQADSRWAALEALKSQLDE